MIDKTELTREEVAAAIAGLPEDASLSRRIGDHDDECCIEMRSSGGKYTVADDVPEEWGQMFAQAYRAHRQLLATMDELAEARATLAAERGEAEGAPSEGWEYSVEHAEWRKRSGGVRLLVEHAAPNCWQWTLDEYENDYGWHEDMAGNRGDAESMLAREAMRAADATLATMEPPDAST